VTVVDSAELYPHVHYLIPAGGLASDDRTWRPARDDFLVPVQGPVGDLRAPASATLYARLNSSTWCRCQSGNTTGRALQGCRQRETAFKISAPYIFRVAISQPPPTQVENDQVTFATGPQTAVSPKLCTLAVEEFIHRFLQHFCQGFVKCATMAS